MLNTMRGLSTYILDAYVAAQRSHVTRKKMGSVMVGRRADTNVWHIIADGCNGVNPGSDHDFERDGVTLPTVIHSEKNVITKIHSISEGIDTQAFVQQFDLFVLIVMSSPCASCANSIISSFGPEGSSALKLDVVVYLESYRDQTGVQHLLNAGIKCHKITTEEIEHLVHVNQNVTFELQVAALIGNKLLESICSLTISTRMENEAEFERNLIDFAAYMNDEFMVLRAEGLDRLRSVRYGLLSVGENMRTLVEGIRVHNMSVEGSNLEDFASIVDRGPGQTGDAPKFNRVFDFSTGKVGVSVGLLQNESTKSWRPYIVAFRGKSFEFAEHLN